MCREWRKTEEVPRTKQQEQEVYRLLNLGWSEEDIASTVWLSRFTVRWLARNRKRNKAK